MTHQVNFPDKSSSWVPGADGSAFPIQNLPIGVGRTANQANSIFMRIGDYGLSVQAMVEGGFLPDRKQFIASSAESLSREDFRFLRLAVYELLQESNSKVRDRTDRDAFLFPLSKISLDLPCAIPNFTDFYSGIHHASNVGRMFRPELPPLLPNYVHLPVAYNGRASSVKLSGTPVVRPKGQIKVNYSEFPVFLPTQELDFEAELGFYIARSDEESSEIVPDDASQHILGVCLVNDWSARDIQRWEYQPLGPFLAKSFLTSVSPWIISLDALFAAEVDPIPPVSPVLPHLRETQPKVFDIQIEVSIQSLAMSRPQVISRPNARDLYWTFNQQLAHLTSNGLKCLPGELCATGAISGESDESLGSLLELSWRGTRSLYLTETGETRVFLQDGDRVKINAEAAAGSSRIGLGEVAGQILEAK